MSARNKANELKIIRIYDAPVKAVWDAWADPAQTAQWWGPRGFSIKTHSKDLRAGGTWKYLMTGPDGQTWDTVTKYHEVETYKRLVYDHGGTETTPPLFRVEVNFKALGGKTEMDMTMIWGSPEAAEQSRKMIKKVGGNSTWDRLSEYLIKQNEGKEKFEINRTFDTSIETMYKMWSDPDHFSRWLPPTGFTMQFLRKDVRPGGSAFYKMTDGGAVTMFGRCNYIDLRSPDRVVYTQQFCDEKENITRHPMSPTWPETMLTVISLHSEGPNETRVTIQWEPYGKFTAEELNTFIQARAGMAQGWTGSLDKLEAELTR